MSPSAGGSKRAADQIELPGISIKKARISSKPTSTAAQSFFTPRSQKSLIPDPMIKLMSPASVEHWAFRDPGPAQNVQPGAATTIKQVKVAFYDLDGTLIKTKSGKKYPGDERDWLWWDNNVKRKLMELHIEGYEIVIISNQRYDVQSKRLNDWKAKVKLIADDLPSSDMAMRILAATAHDGFRKPRIGLFEIVEQVYAARGCSVDLQKSFYVGDAAGRPNDHSDSDRKWAMNLNLKFYTPEEHFKGLPSSGYSLSGFNPNDWISQAQYLPLISPTTSPIVPDQTREIVIFVGYPGSGKTTFFNRYFAPHGYKHVNQDTLKTRDACLALVKKSIAEGRGAVVDNTNRSVSTRKIYIDAAKSMGVPVRCFFFNIPMDVAQHNNMHRAFHAEISPGEQRRPLLPMNALLSFHRDLELPTAKEGCAVFTVNFHLDGNERQKKSWLLFTA